MPKQYDITLGTIIMKMFVSAIFQILFSMKALFKGQAKHYDTFHIVCYSILKILKLFVA